MPTNKERRKIAARLRKIDVSFTHEEELAAIYAAFGLNIEEYWLHELLADLIESEPERTCHVVGSYYDELMDESYTDLSCGHHLRGDERDFDFCYKCGARVLLCYNS